MILECGNCAGTIKKNTEQKKIVRCSLGVFAPIIAEFVRNQGINQGKYRLLWYRKR